MLTELGVGLDDVVEGVDLADTAWPAVGKPHWMRRGEAGMSHLRRTGDIDTEGNDWDDDNDDANDDDADIDDIHSNHDEVVDDAAERIKRIMRERFGADIQIKVVTVDDDDIDEEAMGDMDADGVGDFDDVNNHHDHDNLDGLDGDVEGEGAGRRGEAQGGGAAEDGGLYGGSDDAVMGGDGDGVEEEGLPSYTGPTVNDDHGNDHGGGGRRPTKASNRITSKQLERVVSLLSDRFVQETKEQEKVSAEAAAIHGKRLRMEQVYRAHTRTDRAEDKDDEA
eukprot:m.118878 g.118878  ORF g.118878 m.118878 type:complete len:280 (+) comp10995_c0_seq3:245-1084(+)